MALVKYYRSEDGRADFKFIFQPELDYIAVYCLQTPSLQGRDPSPLKTHLLTSNKICFAEGREPRTQERAEELAKQWAEYLLEYIRTGRPQI